MNKTMSLLIVAALMAGGALAFVGCESDAHHDHSSHAHGTAAAKPYPLKTCIVTDEKLGDHGKPYTFIHEGQEIQLCCDGCLEDFKKEPAKYTKKIAEAQKK